MCDDPNNWVASCCSLAAAKLLTLKEVSSVLPSKGKGIEGDEKERILLTKMIREVKNENA